METDQIILLKIETLGFHQYLRFKISADLFRLLEQIKKKYLLESTLNENNICTKNMQKFLKEILRKDSQKEFENRDFPAGPFLFGLKKLFPAELIHACIKEELCLEVHTGNFVSIGEQSHLEIIRNNKMNGSPNTQNKST